MHLDPVFVLQEADAPRRGLTRRAALALLGAGGAAAVGLGLGVLLSPSRSPQAVDAADAAELDWALALGAGPLAALLSARSPYLYVVARTADPRLLDGVERLVQASRTGALAGGPEGSALRRQVADALRVSGLALRSPRAAALAARLGGDR